MSLPVGSPLAREVTPAPDRIPAFVHAALHQARGLRAGAIAAVSVPAPIRPPEALARATGEDHIFVWDPAEGPRLAGAGVVAELTARGANRIDAIRHTAAELWPCIESFRHPEARPLAPRLVGGFAFAPKAGLAEPWLEFGDAHFTLPRWYYGDDGREGWLTLHVRADELAEPHRWLGELERVLSALRADAGPGAPSPAVVEVRELPLERWREQVESIRRAIVKRDVEKIVAARCTEVELTGAVDPCAVVERLRRLHPGCFRFGVRFGDVAFVGASPERLIVRDGARFETEALAGSIARAGGDEAAALLASTKDRREQELVVEAIEQALRPIASTLYVTPEPRVRALRDVLHLCTPITGTTSRDVHVLELVAALHPTPAVGGVPTAAALGWISESEVQPRGWYASPVGWFDARGDGEFTVAIRSGVLRGRRAYLYAGAGIVRDSDPDAEYRETQLKQRALLGALGVQA